MSLSPSLPPVDSRSRSRVGPSITVTGLGGARAASVLQQAGYTVIVASDLEYSRLELVDLLVLAPAPPEPAAADLIRQLRQRSSVRTLVLVDGLNGPERERLTEAASDGCMDADAEPAMLVAAVQALIGAGRDTTGESKPRVSAA